MWRSQADGRSGHSGLRSMGSRRTGRGHSSRQQSKGAPVGIEARQQEGQQRKHDAFAQPVVQEREECTQQCGDPGTLQSGCFSQETHIPTGHGDGFATHSIRGCPLLREIFADAIESQAPGLYTPDQIRAWTSLAWLPGVLDRLFRDGDGWISGEGAAFAMRQPQDRLALLYCRGRASRQGHGTALVKRIECDARADGLRTFTQRRVC